MVSYDFSRVFQFLPTLWQALPMTLSILFFTTILGSLFGGLLRSEERRVGKEC